MSLKSRSVHFENLLSFLSFIKVVGLIHLFCHVANRLTAVSLGNSQNCLPQIPKNKIHCSPRDQSIISQAITAAVLMPKSNKKKISSFKLLQSTILRNLAYLVWYTILCLKVGKHIDVPMEIQLSHFSFAKYIFPNLDRSNLFHSNSRFPGTAVLTNQSGCSQLCRRNCK